MVADPTILGVKSNTGDRGVPALVKDSSGNYAVPVLDSSGNLNVNVQTGGGGGTQYTDGVATVTNPVGTMPVYDNAGTISKVGTSNGLPIQVIGTPAVTVSGVATASNQTGGGQKTQVVDGSGNVVGSTSNALDINIKSGNPTTITVTQGTATNLKTQAENYQGGTAVSSINPLQVTLANTGANSTAVKVDNSAVTQPVSGTITANQGGTWTVQPGNTANTTAWKVDGSAVTQPVSGTFWQATQPVSGTVTAVDSAASSATLSNVASSASSVTLLSSNGSRKMATFFNDSTQILYLKFGTTASSTSYTVQLASNAYYEMPHPIYTGRIDGIWASANGNARVTEY